MKALFVQNYFRQKMISGFMALIVALGSMGISYAQNSVLMPAPGTMVSLSEAFTPPLLMGVKVYEDNPFRLDFILDKGNSSDSTQELQLQSTRLIKYFLASITVPEKDLWVNLSPYEKDRIVPNAFGVTEMGRDLLAQDYMLKQITASVIYPEGEIGKAFWGRVYAEAQKRYGTTDIPVDTFNKVWIVPEKALVYENKNTAYVVESRLKVMLEEDYLALKNMALKEQVASPTNKLGSDVVREVVIPILEKEVNEGRNFAQLRQVYQSLILAAWFKDKVKASIFAKAYVDQRKTGGVDIEDKAAGEKIWALYVEAFKKGAYNYIKEDIDPVTQQPVPRKYFSGGMNLGNVRNVMDFAMEPPLPEKGSKRCMLVRTNLENVPQTSPENPLSDGEQSSASGIYGEKMLRQMLLSRITQKRQMERLNLAEATRYGAQLYQYWSDRGLFETLRREKPLDDMFDYKGSFRVRSEYGDLKIEHVVLAQSEPPFYRELFLVNGMMMGYGGFANYAGDVLLTMNLNTSLVENKPDHLAREIFINRLSAIDTLFKHRVKRFEVEPGQFKNQGKAVIFYRKLLFKPMEQVPVEVKRLMARIFQGEMLPIPEVDYLQEKAVHYIFFPVRGRLSSVDKAMEVPPLQKGGIDLSRDRMGLQVQSGQQAVQFNFDPVMIEQLESASGLTPVIIDIQPMTTTIPVFLGVKDVP
ncbi:MAG: hypothetical protein HQL16_00765 [Candidatus Omnitrophica bacterium]|nr:hypothetical protein [Candidatus Omnitrophota bacterium]